MVGGNLFIGECRLCPAVPGISGSGELMGGTVGGGIDEALGGVFSMAPYIGDGL